MSDKLRLTTFRNTPIDRRSGTGYTDIHAETISNVLNLGSTNPWFNGERESERNFLEPLFRHLHGSIRNGPLLVFPKIDFTPPFNEIDDSHFQLGSLVNFPEIRRKQLQTIMARRRSELPKRDRTMADSTNTPKMEYNDTSTPEGSRTDFQDMTVDITNQTKVASSPTTAKLPSIMPNSTFNASTKNTETTTLATSITTAAIFSSEETVVMPTDFVTPTSADDNGFSENQIFDDEEDLHFTQDELQMINTDQFLSPSASVGGPNSNLDIVMFPSQRENAMNRRKGRIQFCSTFSTNFGNRKIGLTCCVRTLNCFDSLPTHLDETIFHHGRHQYNMEEQRQLCYDINDSFTCTRRILGRPNCQVMSSILENKVRPQMTKVRSFYQNTCPTDSEIHTTPSYLTTTSKGNQAGLGSYGWGPIPGPIMPFLVGAFAGLALLIIGIIIFLCCRRQLRKSRRRGSGSYDKGYESDHSLRYRSENNSHRRKSSVYEEIDDGQILGSSRQKKTLSETELIRTPSRLPSAPPDEKVRPENHYYLSPIPSISDDKPTNPDVDTEKEKGTTNFGYLELHTDENGQSYAKLKTDSDTYITSEKIATTPPKDKPSKEEYHTYFVLEKDEEETKGSIEIFPK